MIDLKKFKKIDANKEHTIMEHPDGHKLIISHKTISPLQHKELRGLKMEKGGKVPDPDSDQPKQPQPSPSPEPGPVSKDESDKFAKGANFYAEGGAIESAQDNPPGVEDMGSDSPNISKAIELMSQPQPEQPQDSPPPSLQGPQNYQLPSQPKGQQSQDPFGTEALSSNYEKGLGQEKSGIAGQGLAEAQGAEAVANAAGQGAQHLQQLQAHFQDQSKKMMDERQALMDDMRSGHINPNHMFQDMGVAGKISTAIGLVLGGMGGGITGGGNQALQFLNQQLDRDMRAQLSNLDNKNNLLHANLQTLGNLRDATDMTRLMQTDAIKLQIEKAAQNSKSPQALAAAQQAIGKLTMDSAPMEQNIAARRALLEGQRFGSTNPEAMIHFMVDPKQQAEANKELQSAQNMATQHKNLMNAFDQVSSMGTAGRTVHPGRVAAITQPLLAQLVKDSEGRITPQDTKMMEPLFPAAFDNDQTLALKRQQLDKFVKEKMHYPILQLYGIQPKVNSAQPNTKVGPGYKQ